ncbi:hypothetical protein PFFCH_01984 [Plasmodium falciparum FCH/4]|uniref:Uncharacterized protein n=1 Tax=Plasmodium falciparum FCH/4 TaxID=1036724 RepID=A0A024VQ10_PLAFA|nr:hypothetical protein PFFCH_01984 [Plasmodium falciparum FCH/4]
MYIYFSYLHVLQRWSYQRFYIDR